MRSDYFPNVSSIKYQTTTHYSAHDRAQADVFTLLVLSDQQSKTQKSPVFPFYKIQSRKSNNNWMIKSQILVHLLGLESTKENPGRLKFDLLFNQSIGPCNVFPAQRKIWRLPNKFQPPPKENHVHKMYTNCNIAMKILSECVV